MWPWLQERLIRWWWLDLLTVTVGGALCAWLVAPGTGVDLLGRLDLNNRRNVYTDMLQLAAIFAGLGGVVFAIFLGLQSRSVAEIKSRVGEQLLRVWLSALLSPWFSAFVLIVVKIVDRGGRGSVNVARWVAAAAITLVIFQLVRVLWVFYQIAILEIRPEVPTIKTAAEPARVVRRQAPKEPRRKPAARA
jgi:hypothetical protein